MFIYKFWVVCDVALMTSKTSYRGGALNNWIAGMVMSDEKVREFHWKNTLSNC